MDYIKFISDHYQAILTLLGFATAGGTIGVLITNSNTWIVRLYERRYSCIETNKVIVSQIINGWFILEKISVLSYIEKIQFSKMPELQLGAVDRMLKLTYNYLSNDHQIAEIKENHERCEQYVDKLETYNSILAYRLRGAHHDVLDICSKSRWFLGEYFGDSRPQIDRLKQLSKCIKALTPISKQETLRRLALDVTLTYLLFDYIRLRKYFYKKRSNSRSQYSKMLWIKCDGPALTRTKRLYQATKYWIMPKKRHGNGSLMNSRIYGPATHIKRRIRAIRQIIHDRNKIH